MTNKEALVAVLRINLPDNSLDKALLDQAVTGAETYSAANAKSIDLCAIDLLVGLLSEPDVTEGGFSLKYDRAAVQKQVLFLAKKHGITSVVNQYTPKVTARNIW